MRGGYFTGFFFRHLKMIMFQCKLLSAQTVHPFSGLSPQFKMNLVPLFFIPQNKYF